MKVYEFDKANNEGSKERRMEIYKVKEKKDYMVHLQVKKRKITIFCKEDK